MDLDLFVFHKLAFAIWDHLPVLPRFSPMDPVAVDTSPVEIVLKDRGLPKEGWIAVIRNRPI